MSSRDKIIQVLKKELGYNFSENELNPDTKKRIGDLEKDYVRLVEMSERINSLEIEKRKNVGSIVSTFILLIIFIFVAIYVSELSIIFSIISLLVLISLISLIRGVKKMGKSLEIEKSSYNKYYSEYNSKLKELTSQIHEELKEIHQLRLRPERVEYKVVVSYSMDKGVLKISCPRCTASIGLDKEKVVENKYKCEYCGETFVIPKKILDLL
jgi:ABC-type multidrug transport system fused ATPase/permease subunit